MFHLGLPAPTLTVHPLLTCAALPGRRWLSGRPQPTDLAVVGSNPSRRATITTAQCSVTGLLTVIGPLDCDERDHVGGHFQLGCDHLRPQWPMPTAFLLVSGATTP